MVEQGQNIQARWYAQSPDELARALDVNLAEGLREDDAARRLSMHGRNELPEAPPPSPWSILGAQFTSLIVWVLIGAAIVSGLLG
ncbi:MAG: cation-transporting P-type ATPase, partial [Nitrospira sp.]